MAIAGIIVTLLGFLISVCSVSVSSSISVRLVIVLIGLAVSLGGIIGLLNQAYMKDAIWRK
jgi:ABC-type xylose transport system permease subunit